VLRKNGGSLKLKRFLLSGGQGRRRKGRDNMDPRGPRGHLQLTLVMYQE
jgi:hypothetical protein